MKFEVYVLLTSHFVLHTFQDPKSPIIVRIVETPNGPLDSLARVIFQALGVSGLLTLVAILLGVIMAGLLILIRSRRGLGGVTEAPPPSSSSETSDISGRR